MNSESTVHDATDIINAISNKYFDHSLDRQRLRNAINTRDNEYLELKNKFHTDHIRAINEAIKKYNEELIKKCDYFNTKMHIYEYIIKFLKCEISSYKEDTFERTFVQALVDIEKYNKQEIKSILISAGIF